MIIGAYQSRIHLPGWSVTAPVGERKRLNDHLGLLGPRRRQLADDANVGRNGRAT